MATNTDLEIKLSASTASFTQSIKQAVDEFKKSMAGISTEAQKAKKELDSAFSTLNIKSGSSIQAEADKIKQAFETIKASANSTATDVARASDAMKTKLQELAAGVRGTTPHIDALGGAFTGTAAKVAASIAALVSVAAAIKGISTVITAGIGFEQLNNQLIAATGSSEKATATYTKLRETARSLGLSFTDISKAAVGFITSTKGTNMEGEKALTIFKGFAALGAATGRSVQDMERAFVGLQQIIAKGTIGAEEWKGQIGDALPAANQYLQKELKLTQKEIMELMKEGNIASDVLVKVAEAMLLENAAAGAKNAESLAGKLNILKDTVQDVFIQIANTGAMDALKNAIDKIMLKIKEMADDGSLKAIVKNVSEAIASLIKGLVDTALFIGKNITAIGSFVAALLLIKTGAFFIGIYKDLVNIRLALLAVGIPANALSTALKGIPLVFAAIVGWEIGTWISDNFIVGKSGIDEATKSAEKFNDELKKIKPVDTSKAFEGIDTGLKQKFAEISKDSHKLAGEMIADNKLISMAFKAEEAFKLAAYTKTTDSLKQQANALSAKQKELADAKAAYDAKYREEDIAFQRQKLQREITANSQKNGSILAADKALEASRAQLAALSHSNLNAATLKLVKDGINTRIAAENSLAKHLKQQATALAAEHKIADSTRATNHKVALDAMAVAESKLKAEVEALEAKTLAAEIKYINDSKAGMKERSDYIIELNKAITAASKEDAIQRAQAEKEALAAKIALTKEGQAVQIEQIKALGQVRIDEAKKALDDEKNSKAQWYETEAAFNERRKGLEQDYYLAVQGVSNRLIAVKTEERAKLQGLLDAQLLAQKEYNDKISALNDQLAAKTKSYRDEEFQTDLRRMTEGQRYVALQGEIAGILEKLTALREAAATQSGGLTAKQVEEFQELESSGRAYNKELESLGSTAKESAVSATEATAQYKNNLAAFKDVSIGMIQDQKGILEASKDMAEKAGGSIDVLKNKIKDLDDTIKAMGDVKKSITIDADTDSVTTKLDAIKNLALQGARFVFGANTDAVDGAINRLRQDTFSTHYIREHILPARATGGIVQKFANGGFTRMVGMIRGAGTATSDSIRAMLSNGEYVIRASSVQKWGKDFFDALNSGYAPPIKHFATGGLVGGSTPASNSEMTLNFNIGSKTLPVKTSRDTAMELAGALRQLSRAS